MWHSGRITPTQVNLVHARRNVLWDLYSAWDAAHLPFVWHSTRVIRGKYNSVCRKTTATLVVRGVGMIARLERLENRGSRMHVCLEDAHTEVLRTVH